MGYVTVWVPLETVFNWAMNRIRPDARTLFKMRLRACQNFEAKINSENWLSKRNSIICRYYNMVKLIDHDDVDHYLWIVKSEVWREFSNRVLNLAYDGEISRRTDGFDGRILVWIPVRISVSEIECNKLGVKSDYDHSATFGPTWVNIESKFGLAILIKNFRIERKKNFRPQLRGLNMKLMS